MAETKTKPTKASVKEFIEAVESEQKKKDSRELLKMMQEITGEKPVMWGPTMIGFGSYHYRYESGHEGDAFMTGFSPRKGALSIYIMPGFERFTDLMSKLGKYKIGKSCLYINKLDDIDRSVLRELIARAYERVQSMH